MKSQDPQKQNRKQNKQQQKSKTTRTNFENKNNQSEEHQHRRLFTFASGAIVSPNTLYIAAAWGVSGNVMHAFCSVAVRDALSLPSSLFLVGRRRW